MSRCLLLQTEGERAIKWRLNIDVSRTKTPRYWGGDTSPCPIGIDATGNSIDSCINDLVITQCVARYFHSALLVIHARTDDMMTVYYRIDL